MMPVTLMVKLESSLAILPMYLLKQPSKMLRCGRGDEFILKKEVDDVEMV